MHQAWENGKNLNFGPDFDLLNPNLGSQNLFGGFHFN